MKFVQLEKQITWPTEDFSRIPRKVFVEPELFDMEMERIFQGSTWNLVGHVSEIPQPGDFKTGYLGNIPIIVVRDNKSPRVINVLVNTCAHRGAEVERRPCGNAKQFSCLYHKWTYNLSGEMIGAPFKEDIPPNIEKEEMTLKKLNVAQFHGLIFASFQQNMVSIDEYLGDIGDGIRKGLGDKPLIPIGNQKVVYNCNWKLYSENVIDGYHTGYLHAAFRMLRMFSAGGVGTTSNYGSGQFSYKTLPLEKNDVLNDLSILEKTNETSFIMNFFPTSVVSTHLETIGIRYVIPHSIDKTLVYFQYFMCETDSPEKKDLRIKQASNVLGPLGLISLEDAAALEAIQKSAVSGGHNIILKPSDGGIPIHSEVMVRNFWKQYHELMGL
ncbi:aromatic ring-hydroxylating dioxygenase subunit alpha [Paenibacillus validus]|uniref:Rieske 2Fe-2S domain-containing protein n=1 Tax=Paenibacillus validus TaxID=44253 RepID=A0A7X2Z7S5_9BACL|nr:MULTISPECIES: aromatic ring-hydroxylating dioxygenase subunit alpha [Paenibacillus]MED4602193.1 aromatic ring-hydroxylating dioxygenase subunit alpha [Paenibacillus validus]MED4607490.1 aromatic ring-hydroxylating dioxygenase subunit alpha [Paenibacillus validus]MUG69873.1 Rieske 2Fe-2S domain-containing protein [Paenibacillus validus]